MAPWQPVLNLVDDRRTLRRVLVVYQTCSFPMRRFDNITVGLFYIYQSSSYSPSLLKLLTRLSDDPGSNSFTTNSVGVILSTSDFSIIEGMVNSNIPSSSSKM